MTPCSQDGSSEEFIGEWMEQRGNREQLVIATKVRCIEPIYRLDSLPHIPIVHNQLRTRGQGHRPESALYRQ